MTEEEKQREKIAKVFQSLSSPTRLKILEIIAINPEGSMTITEVSQEMMEKVDKKFTQAYVSRESKSLKDSDFLVPAIRKKRGKDIGKYYKINDERIAEVLAYLTSLINEDVTKNEK